MDFTQQERQTAIKLYNSVNSNLASLPYSSDLTWMFSEFKNHSNRNWTIGEFFHALTTLRTSDLFDTY